MKLTGVKTEAIDTKNEVIKICEMCGRPVLPTGIWMMPIEGFCECVFWRA